MEVTCKHCGHCNKSEKKYDCYIYCEGCLTKICVECGGKIEEFTQETHYNHHDSYIETTEQEVEGCAECGNIEIVKKEKTYIFQV